MLPEGRQGSAKARTPVQRSDTLVAQVYPSLGRPWHLGRIASARSNDGELNMVRCSLPTGISLDCRGHISRVPTRNGSHVCARPAKSEGPAPVSQPGALGDGTDFSQRKGE